MKKSLVILTVFVCLLADSFASSDSHIPEQVSLQLNFFPSEFGSVGTTTPPKLLSTLPNLHSTPGLPPLNATSSRFVSLWVSFDSLLKYLLTALLVVLLFGYWIHRLRREIRARRRSEKELAMLYSKMSLGFALYKVIRNAKAEVVDAQYLEVNPMFCKIVGANPQQCVGKMQSKVHIPCLNSLLSQFIKLEAQHQPVQFETRCQITGRWVEAYSYQASAHRFVLLLQDISQRKQDELTLKANEAKLRLSQQYGGIATWAFDMVNNRRVWSEIINNGLGVSKSENPKWAHFLASVCREDRPLVIDALHKHLQSGRKFDVEYRINVASKKCWMRSVGQLQRDENGKPLRMLGIVQDISERKRADEKLKLSARVFSDAHEGIMITDANARILDVNTAFTEITGYSRDEVIGQNPKLLKSDRQDRHFYLTLWNKLLTEGHWQGEIWNKHKNGHIYAQLLTISALRDDTGATINFLGLFSDITESKMHQQKLEYLAHYDPLTGLPNRSLFADRFMQAIAHSKRTNSLLAVCYLDLDGFKPVNDGFGHETGDELLVEVAKRIKSNLRECDTVSRLGGDEFALLLQDLGKQPQCEETLKRIHKTLAEPFILQGQPIRIGASSGLTLYPLDNIEPDTLLRHADQAMYQAKHAGRNCYRVYQDLIADGVLQADIDFEAVEG